jgi:hypothetical protein
MRFGEYRSVHCKNKTRKGTELDIEKAETEINNARKEEEELWPVLWGLWWVLLRSS